MTQETPMKIGASVRHDAEKRLNRTNRLLQMNGAALARFDLEHPLRLALDRNEFLLHYQPGRSWRTNESIASKRHCAGIDRVWI